MSVAFPAPPRDLAELLERAAALAGRTLGWVAQQHRVAPPKDPRREKGWSGRTLEIALGATAGSRAEPDFPHLHVELKSLPVDARGRPRESTYVCTASLDPGALGSWRDSWVRRKLSTVLWVPLIGAEHPVDRVVGSAVLWSPTLDEERALCEDFTDLTTLISLGLLWQIDGRRGKVLQLRPKAADGSQTTWALDEDAEWVADTPRGFYLRPAFTGAILARELILPE